MSAKEAKSAWLDDATSAPLIAEQAQRLESFLAAVADARIDDTELKQQEARVVELMRRIEPQLTGELHADVTRLLCELTAYDLMQFMHSMHAARPKTVFQG